MRVIGMFRRLVLGAAFVAASGAAGLADVTMQEFKVLSLPHDVACTADGIAWYSAQRTGALGRLDPKTGAVKEIPLGKDSSPHGVIVGPDGALWLTDSGQNAIVRVDPGTEAIKLFRAPPGTPYMNLNTAAFDGKGVLWFTGQAGYYGKADPRTGEVRVWNAPKGRGPYGIAATPKGDIYYASLAASHIARIDTATGQATVIEPPNKDQGARRVWSDSKGVIWVSEWNSGHVSRYDPADKSWKMWQLPTAKPLPYAVYVDEKDKVWLSDFGGNAMIRFDPATEKFDVFKSPREAANVRQILGCPGQVWAPESGTSTLVVFRY